MKAHKNTSSTLALLAVMLAAPGLFSTTALAQDKVQTQIQIYGSQLMTDAERIEYQTKMRALKTTKERDAFRVEHHDLMKLRAADQGINLPNTAPDTRPSLNAKDGTRPGTGAATGAGQGAGQGKGLGK